MKKYFCVISILLLTFVFLLGCKEKEKEMESSPNMLVSVRTSTLVVEMELEDEDQKEEIIKEIDALLMNDSVGFIKGHVYEMKLNAARTLDVYRSEKDYEKNAKAISGDYSFDKDAMVVNFQLEDKKRSFSIGGHSANIFYNHFVRNEGSGAHHIVEGSKVFCLNGDYTELFKQKYPTAGIELVIIKTDMMTIRSLETFK